MKIIYFVLLWILIGITIGLLDTTIIYFICKLFTNENYILFTKILCCIILFIPSIWFIIILGLVLFTYMFGR